MKKVIFGAIIAASFMSCGSDDSNKNKTNTDSSEKVESLSYTLLAYHPHDTTSFTEGFLVHKGQLFESTGATSELASTRSLFGIVDLKTGKIDKKAELDKKIFFGEGIAILDDKIYQVTYKNQKGFVYDAKTFKKIKEFSYQNLEGWGMTTDGKSIIMSDGSNVLTYFDPNTMNVVKTLPVTFKGYAEKKLNELEFIEGYIYANVWQSSYIVKIDPSNGKVVGKLDLSDIAVDARTKYPKVDVLNGIAYDNATKKVYITGKLYSNIYEIALK